MSPEALQSLALVLGLGLLALGGAALWRRRAPPAPLPIARRDVIDHLPEGVLIADESGVILDLNPAAERILRLPAVSLRHRPLAWVLGRLAGDDPVQEPRLAALAAAGDGPAVTVELQTPDERSLQVTTACVRRAGGRPAGRFAMLCDRTAERRYERFVRQSQKLESVGVLAAGIAHEVNNPLAYVRSNLIALRDLGERLGKHLDDLGDDAAELAELPQMVAESLDGIGRITGIVDGLRRFSRLPREEREPLDCNAVLREAIRLAELHRNRHVRVEARLAADLPRVSGSAERLGQVFLNLLLNAKHALAGREDGTIVAETRFRGGWVEVHVSDNGPGIPGRIRERIFDPFFTTKGPDEGTGLGLSIAFDIVREHDGSLELLSPSGAGAHFVARFPASGGAVPPSA